MTGHRFAAVLFDLDGTVWDSASGILDSLAHALRAVGESPGDPAVHAQQIGPALRLMLADAGVPDDRLDEGVAAYRERYRTHGEFDCVLYEGMGALLAELQLAGLRLATATSKSVEPARRMVEHHGVRHFFDIVAAAPMTASGPTKAAVIAEALAGLDLDGSAPVAMVGDRRTDIVNGRGAGLVTIGVTWGYGGRDELTEAGADHIVDDVTSLRRLLLAVSPEVEGQR